MIVASLLGVGLLAAPPDVGKAAQEYVAKLAAAEPTAAAQFKLGEWARQHGMKDAAEGHLRAAVFIDPNLAAAQKALGRKFQDGRWETKEERLTRLGREAHDNAERDQWQRRLNEVGVEHAAHERTLTAAAAEAVEQFAAGDPERSLAAVSAFRASESGAATAALLHLALESPYSKARAAAVQALAERNADHVLPTLLESVRGFRPLKTTVAGVGDVWQWQDGTVLVTALPAFARPGAGGPSTTDGPSDLERRATAADAVRANATSALQSLTGRNIGPDYAAWRGALLQVGDSYIESKPPRPTRSMTTSYESEGLTVGTARPQLSFGMQSGGECFAAGTPVATKRGAVSIDRVCIGELVLSRNPESGETAFKPILARTLRPRTAMAKLTIGSETLTATVGHPFWTSEGWAKVKKLERGAVLMAEDGKLALVKSEPAEPAQAYNLVVADFATYFVGKSRVLVHDNTPIVDLPVKAK